MVRLRVDPPQVMSPPHRLRDIAEVVTRTDAHWRTGIEYDSVACHASKVWGPWCTGVGLPSMETDIVTLSIEVDGSETDGDYVVSASVESDGDYARQVAVRIVGKTTYEEVYTETGDGAVEVASSSEGPLAGWLIASDVLTGVSGRWPLAQDEDGVLVAPESPVLMAVPQGAVPDDCEPVITGFVVVDGGSGLVEVTITAEGDVDSDRVITIGGHRITLAAGEDEQTVSLPLGEGTWPITVRYVDAFSLAAGWIYIDPDGSGSATLVQATCPAKGLTTRPWQTQFRDTVTVFADVSCQSLGLPDAASAARAALAVGEDRAIEAAYWDSLVDRSRTVGDGISFVAAIAELEHYLAANYNGVGILHMPAYAASWLAAAHNVLWNEPLRTIRGTPIVIGAGYPRQASEETEASFAIFATGAVRIYQSEVQVYQSDLAGIHPQTNDRSALAERTVAFADDCVQPAVVFVDPVAGSDP